MNRRITQEDIANKLGLHKSTVSLALRDNPGIALATRKQVQAMSAELGYRPDPALATLARQRWAGHETGSGSTLVYLIDSRTDKLAFQRRFVPAARTRAEARGYLLQEFDLAAYPSMLSAGRVLYNRGIRGLLVPQLVNSNRPSVLDLPVENFTMVCLDLGWVSVPFHIVAPDAFESTRLAWKQTVDRGYQRVGGAIFNHVPRAVDDAPRHGASLDFIQQHFPRNRRIPLLTGDPVDRDAFIRWLDHYEPDAVIGLVPTVLDWIVASGRRVPEDIGFASLSVRKVEDVAISGVLRRVEDIGTAGVDALIAAMNENQWGVPVFQSKLLLEPVWHEGTTLPHRR